MASKCVGEPNREGAIAFIRAIFDWMCEDWEHRSGLPVEEDSASLEMEKQNVEIHPA